MQQKLVNSSLPSDLGMFRIMADMMPSMIWVSGTDTGCMYFNTLGLMFTGRTLEQDDCTERHKIPMQCLSGLGVRRIQLTKGK